MSGMSPARNKRLSLLAAMVLAVCAVSSLSFAVTNTWTSTSSNLWNTGTNWSHGVPTTADDDVFGSPGTAACAIPSGTPVNSLTIQPSYTGTITLSGSLTCTTSYSQAAGTINLASGFTVSV